MKCPSCGKTTKSLQQKESSECPDCGEQMEKTQSRSLLMK